MVPLAKGFTIPNLLIQVLPICRYLNIVPCIYRGRYHLYQHGGLSGVGGIVARR